MKLLFYTLAIIIYTKIVLINIWNSVLEKLEKKKDELYKCIYIYIYL